MRLLGSPAEKFQQREFIQAADDLPVFYIVTAWRYHYFKRLSGKRPKGIFKHPVGSLIAVDPTRHSQTLYLSMQGSSEVFFRKVKFWDKGGRDAPPVFIADGVNYLHVKVRFVIRATAASPGAKRSCLRSTRNLQL